MPINVVCPSCQKELAAPDELAGQVAECPYCQNRLHVQAPTSANAQTVRMSGSTQRGSTGSSHSGKPAIGGKVSMGAPPAAAVPTGSTHPSGKQKPSVAAEKGRDAARDAYPPVTAMMPPHIAAPANPALPPGAGMSPSGVMPPQAAQPPAPPVPLAGSQPSATAPPITTPSSENAPPVVTMPPVARAGGSSVSMPAPPSIAAGPKPVAGGGTTRLNLGKPVEAKRRMNRAVFKSSDTTKSQVHLGADGRLPELKLDEGAITERATEEKKQTNPMLLLAVLGISVGMSVLMLLFDGASATSESRSKSQARQIISERYLHGNPLEAYQLLLREAQQANAQGKYVLERQRYRRVLDMLHSEGKNKSEGLTGLAEPAANNSGAPNDRELERQLSILIAD